MANVLMTQAAPAMLQSTTGAQLAAVSYGTVWENLDKMSASFTQLAQIGGESTAALAKGIGSVTASFGLGKERRRTDARALRCGHQRQVGRDSEKDRGPHWREHIRRRHPRSRRRRLRPGPTGDAARSRVRDPGGAPGRIRRAVRAHAGHQP